MLLNIIDDAINTVTTFVSLVIFIFVAVFIIGVIYIIVKTKEEKEELEQKRNDYWSYLPVRYEDLSLETLRKLECLFPSFIEAQNDFKHINARDSEIERYYSLENELYRLLKLSKNPYYFIGDGKYPYIDYPDLDLKYITQLLDKYR